jgi:hypothetical protein
MAWGHEQQAVRIGKGLPPPQAWIRCSNLSGAELSLEIVAFFQNKFEPEADFPLVFALRPLQKSLPPQRGA